MSDISTASAPLCWMCGQQSHTVPGQTVKALLSASLRALTSTTYWFCATPDCPVVYFAPETAHIFTVDDLRVVVYQKAREDRETPICYCFGHRVGSVTQCPAEHIKAVIDDITQGIRADQCACDLRNPQGSCCLGNVRSYLRTSTKPDTAKEGLS